MPARGLAGCLPCWPLWPSPLLSWLGSCAHASLAACAWAAVCLPTAAGVLCLPPFSPPLWIPRCKSPVSHALQCLPQLYWRVHPGSDLLRCAPHPFKVVAFNRLAISSGLSVNNHLLEEQGGLQPGNNGFAAWNNHVLSQLVRKDCDCCCPIVSQGTTRNVWASKHQAPRGN